LFDIRKRFSSLCSVLFEITHRINPQDKFRYRNRCCSLCLVQRRPSFHVCTFARTLAHSLTRPWYMVLDRIRMFVVLSDERTITLFSHLRHIDGRVSQITEVNSCFLHYLTCLILPWFHYRISMSDSLPRT